MKSISYLLGLMLISNTLLAMDSKVVPLVSSNPNSGTSLGAVNTNIYSVDEDSSPSQLMFMAQYSNTDSWSVVGINTTWFNDNDFKSFTVGGFAHNNSELYIDEVGDIDLNEKVDANFAVDVYFIYTQLLYKTFDNLYLGGQVVYSDVSVNAKDAAGEFFLLTKGIEDTRNSSIGFVSSYDTRTSSEKYYPRDSMLVEFILNFYPTSLGNQENYVNTKINARHYMHGFKRTDVWANQLYGKYSSENTPDSGLPALGSRNVLRGFSVGQFKAKYLSAYQSEYRYQLDGTKFRFAAFAGIASLNGGSKGNEFGNRDGDNGIYSSVGAGFRYALQEKAGVDYRVDIAYTSTDDYGLYATINQSF